ncbi:dynamin family protein [uncultured Nostoc sp.]|uniref:dynamin family protein n=1 Tax=uncultured Nostoc sp. TaxID=340711 RepID=UPI0035C99D10
MSPYPLTFANQIPHSFLEREKQNLFWAKELWQQVENQRSQLQEYQKQSEEHKQLKSELIQAKEKLQRLEQERHSQQIVLDQLYSELSALQRESKVTEEHLRNELAQSQNSGKQTKQESFHTRNEVLDMKNQTVFFDLEVIKVRNWFAEQLHAISQAIALSEQQASGEGASGALALSSLVKNLNEEIDKLNHGKFRFLIIGDFNRGKSTILNAFFERDLLPMGATATTAIPTFVRYGEQEEVLVHKKDGSTEPLSHKEYEEKYTLNSKGVKNQLKRLGRSVEQWLNPLDYAEFYCPIQVLAEGVEFIDTAGLNHTEEENQKTFSYIPQCHAILFVLSTEQQFTQKEQEYLNLLLGVKQEIEDSEAQQQIPFNKTLNEENLLSKHIRPIFYLINKWELVEEKDKKEIHEDFVEKFSNCLGIETDEAEQLWGDSVFDVYAKTALDKLKRGESLEGTGLKEFQKRLSDFLIEDRLIMELAQAVHTLEFVENQVIAKVNERLLVLKDDVESLEKKIKKTKPYVELMNDNAKSLEREVKKEKDDCTTNIGLEYSNFFSNLALKFDREFEMPTVEGLKDDQREQYTQDLRKRLVEYQQEKLADWQKRGQGILLKRLNDLRESFDQRLVRYTKSREEIRGILSEETISTQDQRQASVDLGVVSGETALNSANTSAFRKMVIGAGGGTLGTVAAGIGLAQAANVYLGAHIILAAGLAVTPVGWALLGASAIAGGGLAWWQRRGEVQKFKKEMLEKVKEEFNKLLEPDRKASIEERVGDSFVPFEDLAQKILDDIDSLETSLANLLESKKTTQVSYEAEEERLQAFVVNIVNQSQTIKVKYREITSAISERRSVDVPSNL